MRVLHLSDTGLSGSPLRISALLNKYGGVESRHIVWKEKLGFRDFGADITGRKAEEKLLRYLVYEWADVIHYHNRWKRQEIFKSLQENPPNKPSVIQIHSPRDSEDFSEEIRSGIPLAVLAQYHVRQWPEHKYLVPNMVDIYHKDYLRESPQNHLPVVSYAPSNTNMTGWNDKSYNVVAPVLKRMRLAGAIIYDLLIQLPFGQVMAAKKRADIGIDEITTGSYHLSSLEYLALGVACFANIDPQTEAAIKKITGATELPWVRANKDSFERMMKLTLRDRLFETLGKESRSWMEKYWDPKTMVGHYLRMYEDLK